VLLAVLAVAFAETVPFEYVVRFKDGVAKETISAHKDQVLASGASMLFDYDFGGFQGYAVRVPVGSSLADPRNTYFFKDEVLYFEQSQIYTANAPAPIKAANNTRVNADCNVQEEATWGLVRTTTVALNLDGLYPWSTEADGTGVYAYVIDTGIYLEHNEFERRATWGYDAVANPSPENDPNGHGTHVAGTIMSNAYGIAKKAFAVAVRVLGATGSGTTAGVIAGIQFTARDGAGKKAVANMSLGGGRSQALNDAVKAAVGAGIPFVVAAGNEATDACNRSPASEPTAITAMCSDSADAFCYFSNYGSCTDIIAPGMSITSTWINGPVSDNTISGTSMSAPHVAGVAAKIISSSSVVLTPEQVRTALSDIAGQGYIRGVPQPTITPNHLLHYPCD